jgi:hypothetical protein
MNNDAAIQMHDEATQQELEEYGRLAEQWCREAMAKCENKWKEHGKTFAWFRQEPDWGNGSLSWFWLEDPKKPCKRKFRFSLIGGGQITATQTWRWRHWANGKRENSQWTWKDDHTVLWEDNPGCLHVVTTAHEPDGVRRYSGAIETSYAELSCSAAVFGQGTPQEIANRVAATLSAIGTDPDDFYALLDSSAGCAFCARPLHDEISKLVAVGPDCARKFNVPHSMAAASKRLELRRKLLCEPHKH